MPLEAQLISISTAWPLRLTALLALCTAGVTPVESAELKPATIAAFDRYVSAAGARMTVELDAAANRFLWLSTQPETVQRDGFERLQRGELLVERLTATDHGRPIEIPGGLVHHWVGLAFLPGVTLERTIALLQDYDHHASIYTPRITRSTLRSHAGDVFQFHLRFLMQKGIAVVVDTENIARFVRLDANRAASSIVATRIAEVDNPGTPAEREKPSGNDSGYLWRLNTYWHFLHRDGGTYVQCESISLSRGIPTGLGWLIGPFVTSLPRESLEFTLETTRRALAS
jgi:hypothetical protein